MSTTKEKILDVALELFNEKGLAATRVIDIAKAVGMSPGNLTYHYKTKKALLLALIDLLDEKLNEIGKIEDQSNLLSGSLAVTRRYMQFQIDYRFYSRDTLEIIKLVPELKPGIKERVERIVDYNYSLLKLWEKNGIILPEPHKNHYKSIAFIQWSTLNSWITEQLFKGTSEINYKNGLRRVFDLYFPYLSEEMKEKYRKVNWKNENWSEESFI